MASDRTAAAAAVETLPAQEPQAASTPAQPETNHSTVVDVNKSQPQDFDGAVTTNNEIPSADTLRKIDDLTVLDRDGKTHTFKSLYSGRNVPRRVLFVFVRHFFCGVRISYTTDYFFSLLTSQNCQEYLRTLSESITPEALLGLPISTFIVVIGCGDPALVDMYVEATKCPFPLYTDPTRALFDELGMVKTLALGSKPAYMKKGMWKSSFDSVLQGLRVLPQGLSLKSGDQRQVGGEFLFEPLDMVTPMNSPGAEGEDAVEEKKITWCHRMRTTRDHAEIPELMEVLGLDGHGQPIKDEKLWSKAMQARKGVGVSLASEMNKITQNA